MNPNETSVTSPIRVATTLTGLANMNEALLPLKPLYDVRSTLNSAYGVFPTAVPENGEPHPKIAYFGIGIGGRKNINDNLQTPNEISTTNMNLYRPMPIRIVPAAQDLTDLERQQYRMRVPMQISIDKRTGYPASTSQDSTNTTQVPYVAYYLKCLQFTSDHVQYYVQNTSSTGGDGLIKYTPNYADDLHPTPPQNPIDGQIDKVGSEVKCIAQAILNVTGEEVAEYVNVLMNGNMLYADISEIGLFTGTDRLVEVDDIEGNSFKYTESIMTQLYAQMTCMGYPVATPNAQLTLKYDFGSGRVIAL